VSSPNETLGGNAFLPLALVAVTLVVGASMHTVQLLQEKDALEAQRAAQEPVLENAKKLRGRLEALAGGLATLANQGNANAKALVAELGARGITVRPVAEAPK
jgi:hypothetical protein